jgi:hypothetical protein
MGQQDHLGDVMASPRSNHQSLRGYAIIWEKTVEDLKNTNVPKRNHWNTHFHVDYWPNKSVRRSEKIPVIKFLFSLKE